MTRRTTLAFALAALALAAVAAVEARSLYLFYLDQTRLPMWDMAGHGWGGVELLQALSEGRPLRFLDLLNRQDKWPFGYSLLLLPFVAVGDATFASATLLSAGLFVLIPPLLLWAAREVDDGPPGFWGGLLAAALFLASPFFRVFGILVMREIAGVFFSLLAFCLYLRARRIGSPWAWRFAGLASLGLFLVKYNYGLLWGIAVLANEVLRRSPEERRELAQRIGRLFWPGAPRWPGRIVLAVWLWLLAIAAILGINFGVGLYAGLVVGAVLVALRWRRDREGVRAWWRSLPVEIRAALETVVIPLWIWCLSPDPVHPKNIVAFLRNRSTGPPLFSADSLLFYFRSLARDYTPDPLLGWAVAALLAVSLMFLRRGDERFRFLALAAFLGLGLATFHPYKEPRFFATAAPFVLLLAAMAWSRLVHLARPVAGGLLCAGALAGIAFVAIERADLPARLAADYKVYSAGPAFRKPLGFLARWTPGPERVAVLGTFNELSESLVRWWLYQDPRAREATIVDPPSRFDGKRPPEEIRKKMDRWLEEERPERIVAIRLLPESPIFQGEDFQRYNSWQLAALDALEKDPGWKVTRRRKFRSLDLEMLVLDRRP
ncbi:MAG TPA: hypothetical protein VJ725_20250 [Thermoanaerobaculia bacterium]|nr:hypothetical protein [Thermoanaerobaculia bacterium]